MSTWQGTLTLTLQNCQEGALQRRKNHVLHVFAVRRRLCFPLDKPRSFGRHCINAHVTRLETCREKEHSTMNGHRVYSQHRAGLGEELA